MVRAYDRSGLLRDISQILSNEKINVLAINTLSDKANHTADMKITIEISGLDALERILVKINQLPNVIESMRYLDA